MLERRLLSSVIVAVIGNSGGYSDRTADASAAPRIVLLALAADCKHVTRNKLFEAIGDSSFASLSYCNDVQRMNVLKSPAFSI